MKPEKNSAYYDTLFREKQYYKDHFTTSWYYPIWQRILEHITPDQRILEIGCGPGQFADMLRANGYLNYFGFDFSKEAITICHKLGINARQLDAYNPDSYNQPYDVVISLEVLEHLEDIRVLKNIRKNTPIIFSLPSFDDPAHLRFFRSKQEVLDRYSSYLDIEFCNQISLWYLIKGNIK